MKISLTKFEVFCREHADKFGMTIDEEHDSAAYYLSEASPQFTAMMLTHGLYIDGDTLEVQEDQLEYIEDEALRVIASFDNGGQTSRAWEEYGLSGDNDVDYNGGYILIFIEALRAYIGEQAVQ